MHYLGRLHSFDTLNRSKPSIFMISYDPKDWFGFIFRIHQSETFRQLIPLMIAVAVYAGLIAYVEIHTSFSGEIREITKGVSNIYSILGFTLSLLLVFRTNSAYERWWDGRKLWGELTNVSRSFAIHMHAILKPEDTFARKSISRMIATFAYCLQAHLKGERIDSDYFEDQLKGTFFEDQVDMLTNAVHQPIEIQKALVAYVQVLFESGVLNTQEIYHFKSELFKLMDVCGGCERIKNTPIPFSYSVFLKKFIFFYVMLFPVIYCMQMSYFIIPVTAFILYVLASIELIAEEIEDPFNGDANDIPAYEIAQNIARNVRNILG